MSLENPVEILREYEAQRAKIISEYYSRIDEIIEKANSFILQMREQIANHYNEREVSMKQAQILADYASRFYESTQRMLEKKNF